MASSISKVNLHSSVNYNNDNYNYTVCIRLWFNMLIVDVTLMHDLSRVCHFPLASVAEVFCFKGAHTLSRMECSSHLVHALPKEISSPIKVITGISHLLYN